jgi:AcrR family transcriptional regulator
MYQEKSESTRAERRIIEQAAHVLAEGRGRTMQEIADISGVGRTTLYRHFRTREDLIRAIKLQAMEDARAVIAASRLDEGDAEAALRRVIAGVIGVGDRYRVLAEEGMSKHDDMHEFSDVGAALLSLVERGQREGAFTTAMSPQWILTAMGSLLMTAIEQIHAGELARNHAAATVADTLLHGIRGTT